MPSSGMLRNVAHVRTDVSEERIATVMRLKTISELGTASIFPSSLILSIQMMEAIYSS
jgi:hypothetical protein